MKIKGGDKNSLKCQILLGFQTPHGWLAYKFLLKALNVVGNEQFLEDDWQVSVETSGVMYVDL